MVEIVIMAVVVVIHSVLVQKNQTYPMHRQVRYFVCMDWFYAAMFVTPPRCLGEEVDFVPNDILLTRQVKWFGIWDKRPKNKRQVPVIVHHNHDMRQHVLDLIL